MKNMKTKLCAIRDIYRAIYEFEGQFQQEYNLSLNEGMLLCSLETGQLTSGKLAELLGLTPSNTSKVIKSAEQKKCVKRIMGDSDKRQVFFVLTAEGRKRLKNIKCGEMTIPANLQSVIS